MLHSFLNSNLDEEKIEFIQLDQENDDNDQLDWFNLKINLIIIFDILIQFESKLRKNNENLLSKSTEERKKERKIQMTAR